MLFCYRIWSHKTRICGYKAFQNANILTVPLYNCNVCCIASSRYSSQYQPCDQTRSGSSGKKHTVTYKLYVRPCERDHDHKNMSLGRPMSPHLTIYAPTMTSMTSILQRITGITTTILAMMLSCGALFLPNGIETYVSVIQSLELSPSSAFMIKLCVGLPFTYHYFNGIRFCAWNAGKLLSKPEIFSSANKAIIASIVATVFFALL